LTLLAAAAGKQLGAIEAADEQLVAVHIRAIEIEVAFHIAITAGADHFAFPIFADRHCEAVIENEQLSPPMLRSLFQSIFDHAPLKLEHLVEPFLAQQSGVELAPDPSRAVHHHLGRFRVAALFEGFGIVGKFAELLQVRQIGSFEMADIPLVVVAHVQEKSVVPALLEHLLPFFGRDVLAAHAHVDRSV